MTVIILTHTREKLQFVQKENEVVSNELSELDNKLTKEREQLANLKRSRDKFRYENQRLRQKIGIVDSEDLNRDHDNLKKNIEREKNLCKRYEVGRWINAVERTYRASNGYQEITGIAERNEPR